jgi:hypothetical protein
MKFLICILGVFNLECSNSGYSGNDVTKFADTGKIIINKYLKNQFSDQIFEGVTDEFNGSSSNSHDSSKSFNYSINANLEDSTNKFYNYLTLCQSYYIKDTIAFEFSDASRQMKEKVIIYVVKDNFSVKFYTNQNGEGRVYDGIPIRLELKDSLTKDGNKHKILGQVEIKVSDPENKIKVYYKGPFTCTLE